MVAPSFQNFTKMSEPFEKNGRMYIDVKNDITGKIRTVRWYTDSEFKKTFGKKLAVAEDTGSDVIKHCRGFDDGPIIAIRDNKDEDEEWLRASVARYMMGTRWYFASTDALPIDAPEHFKYIVIYWDEVKDGDDRHVKPPEHWAKLIEKKLQAGDWTRSLSDLDRLLRQ